MKWEVLEHYVSGGKVRQPVWMSTDYINLVNGDPVWRDGREFVCSEGYDTNDWEIYQESKSQATTWLEAGEKINRPGWTAAEYITLVGDDLCDEEGEVIEEVKWVDTCSDWEIYQEPKSQAIRWLEAGEKLRYPGWTEKAYIYMKDGHIVWCDDNGGGKYEWASGLEEHDDWQIWKPPTLTPVEAMRALLNGEKVRQGTWHDGCYRNIVGGQVVNREGNPASPAIFSGIKYEIYQPPTKCKECGQVVKI